MPHVCSSFGSVRSLFVILPLVALAAAGCASGPSSTSTEEPKAPTEKADRRGAAAADDGTGDHGDHAGKPGFQAITSNLAGDRAAKTAKDRTPANDDGVFPAHDVRTAMHAASGGLHSCATGEAQSLQAALRIESSGKVSKVDITPAASPVAECVRARLGELTVPAFSGDSVTVLMPVALPSLSPLSPLSPRAER